MNKMERYLKEHNYISRNKNKDPLRQQELSKQRAECISNKYNNLVEEKDKEIERLNNIINELEKYLQKRYKKLNTNDDFDRYARLEVRETINKLLNLKEGK